MVPVCGDVSRVDVSEDNEKSGDKDKMVALIVLLLILAIFGGLGFAAHVLWFVLLIAVALWLIGFFIGGWTPGSVAGAGTAAGSCRGRGANADRWRSCGSGHGQPGEQAGRGGLGLQHPRFRAARGQPLAPPGHVPRGRITQAGRRRPARASSADCGRSPRDAPRGR